MGRVKEPHMIDRAARPSESAMQDLFERQTALIDELISTYREGTHEMQPWRVVPAARLLRIWKDAARDGFVRDEKGLERIETIFYENVVKLLTNTEIAGHSAISHDDELDEYFDAQEKEAFVDWVIATPDGGWRISDYGVDELLRLAVLVSEATDPSEKLVLLDRMLNVAHQRSDLSSWFVEGGQKTLMRLSEGDRPSEREEQMAALAV